MAVPATAELAARLPAVPRKQLVYKGTTFDEMDVDAILQLHPEIVLVDELAHTNIEGSKHRKRYEDVMELLNAQIDVISTMNVQHIESVTPMVGRITGVVVRETVPDWVMQRVDEIVLADLTPEALQARMKRGDIYPLERSDRALSNFFRPGNLIALRELALRQVGSVVDRSLESYMEKEHIENRTPITERIAVCISSNPVAQYLIARTAQDGGEDWGGVLCHLRGHWPRRCSRTSPVAGGEHPLCRKPRRTNREDARQEGCAEVVAKVVREKHITQVVFGRSALTGWRKFLYLSAIHDFLRDAPVGGRAYCDPGAEMTTTANRRATQHSGSG